MSHRIFLSAGEVSGDLHGARLAAELVKRCPDLRMVGWGSARMAEAGVELLSDLTPYSAVGITENLPGLLPVLRALKEAKRWIRENRPDAVVLIDYQGANMELAAFAKSQGIPTLYYIAPQEWIWGLRGGTRKVAQQVDRILAVFLREAEAYRDAGARVEFVGHPLLDMLPSPSERGLLASRWDVDLAEPIIGLFPGSRAAEIDRLLPLMLGAVDRIREDHPTAQFLLPVASPSLREKVMRLAEGRVKILDGAEGQAVMQLCDVVLAASGTVTLEAAVVGTPVVAVYKVSWLTAFIAKRVLRLPFVSLPNIVSGHAVIPELLQSEARPERMAQEVLGLLDNPRARQTMLSGLAAVRAQLGTPGAVGRAAEAILQSVS